MHWPIENLVFVAYLDSLFAETRARAVPRLRAVPETLNRLHADAMREHDRPSALLSQEGEAWKPTPDWRLDRQVIRLALYLRERLGVEAGQRVALASELRPEWLIADLAVLGLGAVSVVIDPRMEAEELANALEDAEPRVIFVSTAGQHRLERLDGRRARHDRLITLDTPVGDGLPLYQVLEQGGTLDTPERAQAYRGDARGVGPDRPAVRHYQRAAGRGWDVVDLSQGEVIERLRAGWLREPARPGDLAYVCDPTVSLATRLALYAFLGDGYTTMALPSHGPNLSDLAALHPTKIVAPAALFAEAVRGGPTSVEERPGRDGRWPRHASPLEWLTQGRRDRGAIRQRLGGRARWIGPTDSLDPALAGRLGTVATVEPASYRIKEVPHE
jgi:long-chain acyl-CoA synthetase